MCLNQGIPPTADVTGISREISRGGDTSISRQCGSCHLHNSILDFAVCSTSSPNTSVPFVCVHLESARRKQPGGSTALRPKSSENPHHSPLKPSYPPEVHISTIFRM